ncbi:gluconate 2-dehydrogenase subunit 3 family protein [Burkholderia multivorans]|uniref:gluconate 2-dehydrogenase subunit 3 family protein n=1 Tax=Burkholderia multivorans TaxID=87883 RepID=UPI001C952929|nr:gluconate 2-dehydrogenase subunit 3 family protein [Burkholderia multivorans]MBY4673921.1 gluconate 2-dehydrogenase subunit 3 family protein [Burkholderia multivorans]
MSKKTIFRSRRNFLSTTLTSVPALGLLGSSTLLSSTAAVQAADQSTSAYEPRYFNQQEWAFVNAAVDRLIPASEAGPGALELGVAEFIDREMEGSYGHGGFWYMHGPFVPESPATLGYQLRFTPRELYRAGIAAVDRWCNQHHGKSFSQLDPDTGDAVLHQLEEDKIALDGVPAATFFAQLLQNTKEGYLADPMYGGNKDMGSWKMIGFPGARADFMDWVEQPGKVYPFGPVSIKGEKA